MTQTYYLLIWLVLTLFPVITAWKRRWLPFVVYLAGWLLFLYSVWDRKDGWDALADIATLIVLVIPIYLIASILWLIGNLRNKRVRR
jgi:ABC-type dipeptide/oligopeptide/nickel transport system permease component